MIALTCPRCGAPLPHAPTDAAAIVCAYCRASIARASGLASAASGADDAPPPLGLRPEAAAYCVALSAALQAGDDPHAALESLARRHLGVFGETDAMARVTLALAADFETETGIDVRADGVAMSRLVEGYFRAIDAIRGSGRYELALRFFAADGNGPRDLVRTLDAATIAALAARDPATTKKKAKKRGFWPFS